MLWREVSQAHAHFVFGRELRRTNRPGDIKVRVVPQHTGFRLRVVLVGALVGEHRDIRGDAKAVRKAGGDVDLTFAVGGEQEIYGFAESGRSDADIDDHIEYFALQHIHQLALRVGLLEMQSA